MSDNGTNQTANLGGDEAVAPVPLSRRHHWLSPAIVFGGLEFTIPVIMVGSSIIGSFSLLNVLIIVVIGLLIQWLGNALVGYMGAKSGRPSSVLARSSFGVYQGRFLIGILIFFTSMGWWAIQTAVAGEAISAAVGVSPGSDWFKWAGITTVMGLIFAVPSIIGYTSMKWTDYLAVPAGLALMIAAIVIALRHTGFSKIVSWNPDQSLSATAAITLVLGANVAQWLIAPDYTRYAKPTKRDNILIPLGIVAIGFPLFLVGAVMSVGAGEADIVKVMDDLGFPFWGFLVLWLATWTSQLVNNYSMGLALANVFNINSGRGRALLTFGGTLIAIVLALAGIVQHFEDFLNFTAILYAAAAGVMLSDFYIIKRQVWSSVHGWNWRATIAFAIGIGVGTVTQYAYPVGLPPVQTLIVAGLCMWLLTGLTKGPPAEQRYSATESVKQ